MLSERGFGCGYVDRTSPGLPRVGGADSASCEIGGKPAVLHVFEHYPSTMKSSFETGSEGGWIVGDNYVVTLHDTELAIEAADALGAEALYDRALLDS